MAVGTAFVGGTSLALAPLRVFLLDAEDEMGKVRDGSFLGRKRLETGRVWFSFFRERETFCL